MRRDGLHRTPAAGAGPRTRAAAWVLLLAVLAAVPGAADVRVFTTRDGLPSDRVTALAPASEGKLWVGTGNAGLFLFDPATGKGKGYRTGDGLSSDEVTSVALFRGKVYVGTAAGLSVFDGSAWETISKVETVTMRNVLLAASPDGRELWACSVYLAGGTVRFDGAEWKFMGGQGRGLFNNIQGFAFLPDGVLMGAMSGGAFLHRGGGDVTPMKEGLPPVNILSAGVRDGKALAGTNRGLFEFDGKWREVPLPVGPGNAAVFSIASRGGTVALGTSRGVGILGKGKARFVTRADGLPPHRVAAVGFLDDSVAAGTAGGGLALVTGW